jgi:hypothetical protein
MERTTGEVEGNEQRAPFPRPPCKDRGQLSSFHPYSRRSSYPGTHDRSLVASRDCTKLVLRGFSFLHLFLARPVSTPFELLRCQPLKTSRRADALSQRDWTVRIRRVCTTTCEGRRGKDDPKYSYEGQQGVLRDERRVVVAIRCRWYGMKRTEWPKPLWRGEVPSRRRGESLLLN